MRTMKWRSREEAVEGPWVDKLRGRGGATESDVQASAEPAQVQPSEQSRARWKSKSEREKRRRLTSTGERVLRVGEMQ